ncbi:MAG: alpha-hydroxy-acid oxidizing protein [bacterium]|nr:alpha-hydroxy-acid oxidizing protein [bacterium]
MVKTLMIIGGGTMQIPAIRVAKEMGLNVVATDYNPNALGFSMADVGIVMSTKDIEGSVRVAKEYAQTGRIDGVITVGTDASMTVAAVANTLKLPGIRFEVAERATNKLKMRHCFAKNGVPSPRFCEAWTLRNAYKAAKEIGFPLVIKPSDNMGARGVIKVASEDEIRDAFQQAKAASPSGEIVVEEFMLGDELSIDALVYDGQVIFAGIADRIIDFPPYFVELGHTLPSSQPKEVQEAACSCMEAGIRALGIDQGAAKGDIKLTPQGPKIVELAARLSGGFMSGYTLPLATGMNVIQGAIEIALGGKPTVMATANRVSAERAIIPHPGRVVSITGVEEAGKLPQVAEVILNVEPGDVLKKLTSNLGKAGNVITVADTREEAVGAAEKALGLIRVEIGAPPSLSWKEIKQSAQAKFKRVCQVCSLCDGRVCAGEVPGMGGAGTGSSFKDNLAALAKYRVNVTTIHDVSSPDTRVDIFGLSLETPILAAPITGTQTNMGGAIEPQEYTRTILEGCRLTGTIGMVGDGSSPDHYQLELAVVQAANGWGIPIFKPRLHQEQILTRIRAAETASAVAVGIDVDAARFITMAAKGQPVGPKTVAELKELINSTRLPFILKGIMTAADAEKAVLAGAAAIVVSNHGGRVLDYMPGAVDVLPKIVEAVGDKIIVMVDGGIRSGLDVLKCLALGAKAVLVGRPLAIAAVGKGISGVEFIIKQYTDQLKEAMVLTGTASCQEVKREIVFKEE